MVSFIQTMADITLLKLTPITGCQGHYHDGLWSSLTQIHIKVFSGVYTIKGFDAICIKY